MKKRLTILTVCMILLTTMFCGCTKTENHGSGAIISDENAKSEQAYMDFLKGNSMVTVPNSEENRGISGLDSGTYSLQEMKTAITEFEDGYRTAAKLYSSEYLLQTGSIGAGANVSQLISFDEKGHGKLVFLERNYFGTFATDIIYDLIDDMENMSKDFSFVFDYISEKSELQVREYVAGDSVKISVKGWNDNSKIRRGEEQLIDYFVSLGAEKISEEEMDELCAIQEYQTKEVSYKDWDEADTAENEPVTAEFANQALLGKKGAYDEFIADDSEYRQEVAFTANSKVTNFRVLSLRMGDVNEDGRVLFSAKELYSQKELTPEKPLVVTMSFPGDTPSMGISYVDSAGKEYVYSVSLSGLDGSVLLGDVEIE